MEYIGMLLLPEMSEYMFGYVIPYKEELKIREYDIFRAYYCGLCKSLGKEFNQVVRMALNYDFTFLALLLSSLESRQGEIRAETCIANPLKKRAVMQAERSIAYSAHMSIMLTYFKLLDDWKDDKSPAALFGMLPFWFPVRKAKKKYPEKYLSIKENLKQLAALEKNKCEIIDESADAFARLMQEIFLPDFIQSEKERKIMGWLGYNLGRWIYILDAFHDLERDMKQKRYNPVLLQYEYHVGEDLEAFVKRIREPVERSLTFTLDNIAKSFELLDIKYNKSIVENIIYMGLRRKMEQIFIKRGCSNNEKSI